MKTVLIVIATIAVIFVGGYAAAQKPLTQEEVRELIQKASTPADHQKLAQYYAAEAKRLDAQADDHAALAKAYRANPRISEMKTPGAVDTAAHCEMLSQELRKAADEARALAKAHEAMARK